MFMTDEEIYERMKEMQEAALEKMEKSGTHLNSGTFPDPRQDEREWWGYSTCLCPPWLMLFCNNTGAEGVVKECSRDEWAAAYHWPSTPQRWTDNSRVTVMKEGPK